VPTDLSVDEHIDGMLAAVSRGSESARAAGLDASVPTCPTWDVRELVAHTGMVHRWAAAQLTGRGDEIGSGADLKALGRAAADPVGWWEAGADELASTLREVPDDVRVMVFLNDAPPPRHFWARRQCHEATIHAVDALTAQLGRTPRHDETGIDERIAIDGIDELLGGFLTRGRKLAVDTPRRMSVRPDGDLPSWTVSLSDGSAVTARHPPGNEHRPSNAEVADDTLTGNAVDLYLALWNRGELVADEATIEWWRKVARIRWS